MRLTLKSILRELIEQISLFNKYNTSRFTELTYELIKNEVNILFGY